MRHPVQCGGRGTGAASNAMTVKQRMPRLVAMADDPAGAQRLPSVVAGFRLDVVTVISKEPDLRDVIDLVGVLRCLDPLRDVLPRVFQHVRQAEIEQIGVDRVVVMLFQFNTRVFIMGDFDINTHFGGCVAHDIGQVTH